MHWSEILRIKISWKAKCCPKSSMIKSRSAYRLTFFPIIAVPGIFAKFFASTHIIRNFGAFERAQLIQLIEFLFGMKHSASQCSKSGLNVNTVRVKFCSSRYRTLCFREIGDPPYGCELETVREKTLNECFPVRGLKKVTLKLCDDAW